MNHSNNDCHLLGTCYEQDTLLSALTESSPPPYDTGTPFCTWGNWGKEKLNESLKVMLIVRGQAMIPTERAWHQTKLVREEKRRKLLKSQALLVPLFLLAIANITKWLSRKVLRMCYYWEFKPLCGQQQSVIIKIIEKGGHEKVKRPNNSGLYAKLKIKEIYFMIVKIQFNPNFDSSVYSSYKVRPYSHTPCAMNKTAFSLGKNNQKAALALHFCGGLEKKYGFSTVLKLLQGLLWTANSIHASNCAQINIKQLPSFSKLSDLKTLNL